MLIGDGIVAVGINHARKLQIRKVPESNMTLELFQVRQAYCTSEVKVPRGHLLPVDQIATPKPDYRELAGRGKDSEIVALRTET